MSLFLSKEEEKPLTICQKCKDRVCINTGKICSKIEALLPKLRTGGNHKEFPTGNIEAVYNKMKERESGWRKHPVIDEI
jgi:hypothetical protein